MIAFACSECGKKFQVKPEFAGRRTKCPKCGHAFVIPGASAPAAASPPAARSSPASPARPPAEGPKRARPVAPEPAKAPRRDRPVEPERSRLPLLLGVGAGALFLLVAATTGTLAALGYFTAPSASAPPLAHAEPRSELPPSAPDRKPEPNVPPLPPASPPSDPKVPVSASPGPKSPNAPAEAEPTAAASGVRPQKGVWYGSVVGGEFSPMFVQFEVLGDGETVGSLIFSNAKMAPAWLATPLYFTENPKIRSGQFKATQGESELTVNFVSPTEARCRADVKMEVFKNPGLQIVKARIAGEFVATSATAASAAPTPPLPAADSLVGRWHGTTRTFETITLEFKDGDGGSAAYKLLGKSFTYKFDPQTRRVDISGASGSLELAPDGRLVADLQFSFVDVLASGMPTVSVDVKGAFTREKAAAPTQEGSYVGEFVKSGVNLPAFKVRDKVYYLVMTGLKNESFDAAEDLKFMADAKNAETIAASELILLKVKTHQGLVEAARQGRGDLLNDEGVKKLIALVSDEKTPLSVRMMIAHRFGLLGVQFPLVITLQLCRHEVPPGQFAVRARETKDKKNRDVLIISSILPATEAAAPKPGVSSAGAKAPGPPAGGGLWAKAEYAELVFQLSKEQLDEAQMAKIDPANLPTAEGKDAPKLSDKFLLATAKGLPPTSLAADGKGGLAVKLRILREESNAWPADATPLAKQALWGSGFVTVPNPGALAYNLLVTGKPDAAGVFRGKVSGILANGIKFHDIDCEMSPRRFAD